MANDNGAVIFTPIGTNPTDQQKRQAYLEHVNDLQEQYIPNWRTVLHPVIRTESSGYSRWYSFVYSINGQDHYPYQDPR
jgi:hypothetical protein